MRRRALALIAFVLAVAVGRTGQEYDPDTRFHDLFEVLLPELRAAEGGAVLSAARLEWLYDRLLAFRAEHADRWPPDEDFLALVESIHAYAAEHDYGTLALSWSDWNRSLAFEERGRYGEVRALVEATRGRYAASDPHRPLLTYSLAHYDRMCGKWEASLDRLDEAEAEVAALPGGAQAHALAMGLIELERCAVSIELGLFEDAAPAAARARTWADELGDPVLRVDVLVEELNLANAQGDHARLTELLAAARAADDFEQLGARERNRLLLREAIGRAEHERRNLRAPTGAMALFVEAIESGALLSAEERLARTWLADSLIEAGRAEEAAAHVEALARLESPGEGAWCADGLPDRLAVARVVLEADLAMARGDPQEALREQLARTEAAFGSMLERSGATRVSDRGLAVLYARLRMQMTDCLVRLTARVHPADGPERSLGWVFRAQTHGSLARTLDAGRAGGADRVGELLPEAGGLLVFVPGASRSLVFAVDREGVRMLELASLYRLGPLRRSLVRALGHALGADASAAALSRVESLADELGHELLTPEVADAIETWEHVVVVGVDALGYVPFELLPWAGERLGDAKSVSYLPSLPVGLWLVRNRRPWGAERVSVVAAPGAPAATSLAPSVRALEFGAAERRLLLDRCAVATRVFDGAAATVDLLAREDWSDDLVLQIVAHGVRARRADHPPGLLLWPNERGDAVLTPEMAEALELPPVVALTACGAWHGPVRRGDDGRAHLAGSLLLTGARTVVVSYSPIDYRSSLGAMGVFHRELTARGRSPAEALTAARRAAEPGDLTPYLLHVIGLADARLPTARGTDLRIAAAAAMLAVIALAVAARARARSRRTA